MEKPLSSHDILHALKNKTKVVLYNNLQNYSSLAQLMAPYDNAIILYPTVAENVGHWTCVIKTRDDNGKHLIEFFDPYGISPDKEKKWSHDKSPNYLSKLLYESPYTISYNNYPMQTWSNNVNTCGRHVINRIRYRKLSLKEYKYIFDNHKNDVLVTALTGGIPELIK
jgi:hypothetical protein